MTRHFEQIIEKSSAPVFFGFMQYDISVFSSFMEYGTGIDTYELNLKIPFCCRPLQWTTLPVPNSNIYF